MGTTFSHGSLSCSYSSFDYIRTEIARLAGICLEQMEGYTELPNAQSWDEVHDDIKLLFTQPDHDGRLTPAECLKLSRRLEQFKGNAFADTLLGATTAAAAAGDDLTWR